ncbi:MAG TPA: SPOR domain-containing protein [Methylophilaceae bacterium]|jgi:cell division protein FtsN
MAKDYKTSPSKLPPTKQKSEGKGNPLLIGVLVGLLIGIALSVGVALSVKKTASAFQEKAQPAPVLPPLPAPKDDVVKKAPETGGGDISSENVEQPQKNGTDKKTGKDRFTFYDILTEPEKGAATAEVKPVPEPAPLEPVETKNGGSFAQVGAFQTTEEADNLKAKLALLGMDAVIQKTTISGMGVIYRVRVGPYKNSDDMNQARALLAKNGIKSDPVKN